MTFRAVHVGDLHFWSFPLNPFSLLGKRAFGTMTLALRRARAFEKSRGTELFEHIASLRADRVLCSGDFTTTSLPSEFAQARRAMAPLDAARVRIVPGNHDRYTRRELVPGGGACTDFVRTFPFHESNGAWLWPEEPDWPWIDDAGSGLFIMGLDPTTSNGLGCFGRLRPEMLEHLHAWREGPGTVARELWIVCHFPPEDLPGILHRDRGDELRGHKPLLEWIENLAIPVFFLHGHHHHRWVLRSGRVENLVYVNAGAPLMRKRGPADLGFMELERGGDGTTRVRVHALKEKAWKSEDVPLPEPGAYVDLQK